MKPENMTTYALARIYITGYTPIGFPEIVQELKNRNVLNKVQLFFDELEIRIQKEFKEEDSNSVLEE